jgi:sugar phosphate isomerase/epimerase
MIGVSPAFFFSLYTTDFTVKDYIRGLRVLQSLGIEGYQLEVFKADRLEEWEKEGVSLFQCGQDLDLNATQFVAHFLLSATKDIDSLMSDDGYEQMRRVTGIVSQFAGCKTITLPLSPFALPGGYTLESDGYQRLWNCLVEKLLAFDEIVRSSGFRLALEIVPGSLLGGTEGLMRLIRETGNQTIGYNFDTGHAHSSKECIATLPGKLAGRVYGTHLKDNFGAENFALPPGRGSIPWESVIHNLTASGYTGSFDLEIASKHPSEVVNDYTEGKTFIEKILITT